MIDRLLALEGAPSTHPAAGELLPAEEPRFGPGGRRIALHEPRFGDEEWALLQEVLASGLVSSAGPMVERFEALLAARVGAEHGVAVTSGTHALDLLLHALDVGPGDEVVVPALAFISVAATVARRGARPVFADLGRGSPNLDVDTVERVLGPRTRGVIAVHQYGTPVDLVPLAELCDARGLFLLEDACEALGATVRGRPVGGLGDAAVHSFYANKNLTTGNGGAITTRHEALATLLRHLRGYSYAPGRLFWHHHLPFNYRMTALQAALGVAQLGRFDAVVAARRAQAARYRELLSDVPGLRLPEDPPWGTAAPWLELVELDAARFGARPHEVRQVLADRGIETRAVFSPLHVQPVLQRAAGVQGPFPRAEALARQALALPLGPHLADADVAAVAATVREARRPRG